MELFLLKKKKIHKDILTSLVKVPVSYEIYIYIFCSVSFRSIHHLGWFRNEIVHSDLIIWTTTVSPQKSKQKRNNQLAHSLKPQSSLVDKTLLRTRTVRTTELQSLPCQKGIILVHLGAVVFACKHFCLFSLNFITDQVTLYKKPKKRKTNYNWVFPWVALLESSLSIQCNNVNKYVGWGCVQSEELPQVF